MITCLCCGTTGITRRAWRRNLYILYQDKISKIKVSLVAAEWFNPIQHRSLCNHYDVIKWKHFPCYWPFVREFIGPRWIPRTKASDAELRCFLYLRLNKPFSKHWWGWWFETLSRPLWRQSNDPFAGAKWVLRDRLHTVLGLFSSTIVFDFNGNFPGFRANLFSLNAGPNVA